MNIWTCKIGPTTEGVLPSAADAPMRKAVQDRFQLLTGHPANFIFSGWYGTLLESELAVVENREPSPDATASYHFHLKMNDRLAVKRLEGMRGWQSCNKQYLVDKYTMALQDQLNLIRSGLGPDEKLMIDIANYSAFLLARS